MGNSFLKINKINLIALCLLVATTFSYAQLAAPFKIRHQGYVNGDMTMIANNIVNRVDYNNDANSPHDNRAYQGELNDEYMMLYTDIDNDKTTFSSSSADLYLNNPLNKKIVYAGLYWSATYLYNSGVSKGVDKYKAVDSKREAFSPIKIKLPNQKEYTTLGGELIFDGINENKFKESAPYAMYADITDMVKNLPDPTGTYTVANIKATQGKLSGGVAAGWSMFFVYEDADMTGKFITTYDGFAGVTDKPTEINFSGFQTLPMGEVKAKIACAALEGDLNLKGDQIQFKAAENNEFTQLQSPLRDRANIFNSAITIDDKFFDARVPASKNTLGYDSFIMNINNFDNSVLGNNTTDATVKLKTTGDRYFVFFNAFQVEVVKPKELVKAEEPIVAKTEVAKPTEIVKSEPVVVTETKVTKPIEVVKPVEIIKSEPIVTKSEPIVVKSEPVIVKSEPIREIVAQSTPTDYGTIQDSDKQTIIRNNQIVVVNSPKSTKKTYKVASTTPAKAPVQSVSSTLTSQSVVTSSKPAPIESPTVLIANQPEGYYLIVNVFAIHSNATKFVAKLKRKGMFVDYFINPINNYRYVYVSKHDNFADATQMYASNINGQYYDAFWIMTVNKQNNPNGVVMNNNVSLPYEDNATKVAILNRNAVLVSTNRRKVS
jgi:hypothetical protein